jgi:hypothetical protein
MCLQTICSRYFALKHRCSNNLGPRINFSDALQEATNSLVSETAPARDPFLRDYCTLYYQQAFFGNIFAKLTNLVRSLIA